MRINDAINSNELAVFDKLSAGVICTDSDKRILYANRAFSNMYNLSKDEVLHKTCWSILHPNTPECQKCWEHEVVNIESQVNGTPCHILISCSTISHDVLLRIIHDITTILADLKTLRTELHALRDHVEMTIGSKGPLVVCCQCHKIRLRDGSWIPPANVEKIQLASGLSHGHCPTCSRDWLKTLTQMADGEA